MLESIRLLIAKELHEQILNFTKINSIYLKLIPSRENNLSLVPEIANFKELILKNLVEKFYLMLALIDEKPISNCFIFITITKYF